MHTLESHSAVWCPPRSSTPQRDAHRGVWLHCEMHTAEFLNFWSLDSAVGCTPRSLTLRYDAHHGAWLCSMMHTTEFFKKFEYLGEIETKFKNTLAFYQGPRWVRTMKKSGGRKSCDTLPLRIKCLYINYFESTYKYNCNFLEFLAVRTTIAVIFFSSVDSN